MTLPNEAGESQYRFIFGQANQKDQAYPASQQGVNVQGLNVISSGFRFLSPGRVQI